ncbi:hypothetical protein ASD45_08425 [Pseudolabrys sp. Root1462]|uniref:hypothetical protein n=1 Tax=Pseudolabrys sp. Root1462 TaxID=1736466 RepID=UPI0007030C19|nr:hypothetical protein [Pseudolabrys sp. Root1462]KQZ00878.1 hypothetical protein ASD45_08425 [Pseudolabrys sp. Root1462]
MTVEFETLREANLVRQAEWDKAGGIDLAYRGNEMAGEIGEVFEVAYSLIDQMARFAEDLTDLRSQLADELADAEICIDLIAMSEDLPAVEAQLDVRPEHQGRYSLLDKAMIAMALGAGAGQACNIIKKLARERLGIRGSRASKADLSAALSKALHAAHLLAWVEGIDLDAAVRRKFNATSAKVGLQTRMKVAA